ncbi:Cof-type HAD-IIB family hydrolase [Sporomusa sp.]|uniref:Cof-type HAD-IIB family hydrolase n=1 Tax=Sporomusa sp. TaxID=2078658 RepID=UPI002BFBEDDC|nr:Cof-type HAD-IIB family hydrolase [Sporomusa sp.]HWR42364.1 Cof-type HAD-IIB family hydrolase [Sporomusa sp.]
MKLIAIDLDGTLLGCEDQISRENAAALKRAQTLGIEIAIATGRTYREAVDFCRQIGITTHVISSNGALVHSKAGDRLLAVTLDKQTTAHIVSWLEEQRYYYEVSAEGAIWSPMHGRQWLEQEIQQFEQNNPLEDLSRLRFESGKIYRSINLVDRYQQILEKNDSYYKVYVFAADAMRLKAGYTKFGDSEDLAVVSSMDYNFELMHREASKGNGLKTLAGELGISVDSTAAIGDNYNDVSMFATAGFSVAMGNARADIKANCDMVTDTNENHGVANALDRLMQLHYG